MNSQLQNALLALIASFASVQAQSPKPSPAPLVRAHAHNDYEHPRPLLDALEHGFCSVEADIHLVDGQLLVAHDRDKVFPQRTLQSLYLDPLRQRARENGGRIYPNGPVVTLLVDIKSEAEATYSVLREVLMNYSELVCSFTPDTTQLKAVMVIISGNRPRRTMAAEPLRYAAYDGRLEDLDAKDSKHLIPLISDNWSRVFTWRGLGPFPEAEKRKLTQFVTRAHEQGRRIRFWAIPDRPEGWEELLSGNVDLINTDNLSGLREFLLHVERERPAK